MALRLHSQTPHQMLRPGPTRAAGHRLVVPEVIDYELRRELVLTGAVASVALLDGLGGKHRREANRMRELAPFLEKHGVLK